MMMSEPVRPLGKSFTYNFSFPIYFTAEIFSNSFEIKKINHFLLHHNFASNFWCTSLEPSEEQQVEDQDEFVTKYYYWLC